MILETIELDLNISAKFETTLNERFLLLIILFVKLPVFLSYIHHICLGSTSYLISMTSINLKNIPNPFLGQIDLVVPCQQVVLSITFFQLKLQQIFSSQPCNMWKTTSFVTSTYIDVITTRRETIAYIPLTFENVNHEINWSKFVRRKIKSSIYCQDLIQFRFWACLISNKFMLAFSICWIKRSNTCLN